MTPKRIIGFSLAALFLVVVPIVSFGINPLNQVNASISDPMNNQFSALDESAFSHKMEVKIRSDNTLQVTSTLVVENNDSQPIYFYIFVVSKNVSSVFVYDPIGSLAFTWDVTLNICNITMRYPLLENQKYVFSVKYDLAFGVFFNQEPLEYYTLEYTVLHTIATMNFILEVSLPFGYQLLESTTPSPYYPTPTRSSTEDGIVKIIWELDHVLLDFEYLYILRYEQSPFYSPITIYEPGLRYAYIYVILAFFSGAGLSIGVFVLIIKRKYQPAKIDLLSSLLSESEQAVITAINDEGGVAIQRRICERTSFSKSKVSQILLKLEEKNVLKRERWGRTNRVTITNPSFLKIALEDSSSKEASE